MARVWREGQTKPVWIYRLLVTGSIEEKASCLKACLPHAVACAARHPYITAQVHLFCPCAKHAAVAPPALQIWQRQLAKEGLSRVVVDDNANESRTFSK